MDLAARTSITPEELAALDIRRYEGEIRMAESPADLEHLAGDLAAEANGQGVTGFDTETRPAFKVGQSYLPSLVQLAFAKVVWIVPVQRLDASVLLRNVFRSTRLRKVGISVSDDLKKLQQLFPFEHAEVLDLGTVAKKNGAKQSGVRNLCGLYLGFRIPKGNSTSNWAAPKLTPQQVAYAATDAWACRELYLRFKGLGWL